jgi:lysozyme family protein
MNTTFEKSLAMLLKHEGGFVHDKLDNGGMTNLGVTQAVWENYIGKPCTEAEMRALTPEMVAPLYKKDYWDKIHGDELPPGVAHCIFDCAVNSGVGRAVDILQGCVHVTVDRKMGLATIAATKAMDVNDFIDQYTAFRLSFLKRLPNFDHFGKGWNSRVNSVAQEARKLTNG